MTSGFLGSVLTDAARQVAELTEARDSVAALLPVLQTPEGLRLAAHVIETLDADIVGLRSWMSALQPDAPREVATPNAPAVGRVLIPSTPAEEVTVLMDEIRAQLSPLVRG